jgi:hypothetical protein
MDILNLQTGLNLIDKLPGSDPEAADRGIKRFLDSLLNVPPTAAVYLALLERLLPVVAVTGHQLAKQYQGKALPLSREEDALFQRVVDTWLKLASAYTHCARLDALDLGGADLTRLALILHRCLYFTGLAIGEHHRVRRQMAAGLWLDLHGYYARAEEWGVATLEIPDALGQPSQGTHCRTVFLAPLLTELAEPCFLPARDMEWVARLAGRWASLVALRPPLADEALPPFLIDLAQDKDLSVSSACMDRAALRCLDVAKLVRRLRRVRDHLDNGVEPEALDLGGTHSPGQCKGLLDTLITPWSLESARREFARYHASGIARLCFGFPAMHTHVSGQPSVHDLGVISYSPDQLQSFLTFRYRVDPATSLQVDQEADDHQVDVWEVLDQSAAGFRLRRTHAGRRLVHGQLLAIAPHDGVCFLLGHITWLMQERAGGLVAGVALLPGIPSAIMARRRVERGEDSAEYCQCFLLPAVPAVDAERTLILPLGMFRIGKTLEVISGTVWMARMEHILAEGADFERVGIAATE